jgi:hypothetical protein
VSGGWIFVAAAAAYLIVELVALLIARVRWKQVGVGTSDQATGALTLGGQGIVFPPLLEIANESDIHVVLALIELGPGATTGAGRELVRRSRLHEPLVRIDADRYAALLLAERRGDAVQAVARLTDDLPGCDQQEVRIGFASAPDDGADFHDLLYHATARRAPRERVAAVAASIA